MLLVKDLTLPLNDLGSRQFSFAHFQNPVLHDTWVSSIKVTLLNHQQSQFLKRLFQECPCDKWHVSWTSVVRFPLSDEIPNTCIVGRREQILRKI